MPFLGLGVFDEEDGLGAFADDDAFAGHEAGAFLAVAEDGGAFVDEDCGDEKR